MHALTSIRATAERSPDMLRSPAADPPSTTATLPSRPACVERAAWAFYVIAALGSSIGQIWVGVEVPPWPDALPLWSRALLVMPFAIVIDLGGAVASAFGDARRRVGEAAYGWRLPSAASVTLAVGINIVGHASSPYLATVFGGLGIFAYCVWLLHTSARRRDALRASGMLRNIAPAYGLLQWKREPAVTWRARALAIDHGYGLVQSLTAARAQLAAEARRAALATHIEAKIRARHEQDPILASIAATTTPIDDVAQELIDMIDAHGWALVISAEIQPPGPAMSPAASAAQPGDAQVDDDDDRNDDEDPDERDEDNDSDERDHLTDLRAELARMMPANPAACERWQCLWVEISERPDATNKQLADDLATSVRTVQRIRAVGAAGLLDSPQPPTGRLLRLASTNGVPHPEYTS
jgi:hypothetical protein